ncbi:MAG: hypothetical protein HY040_02685 [Planctomycetes bacterium]|nr:hypothetical protein [Planctomycetota bacterium]
MKCRWSLLPCLLFASTGLAQSPALSQVKPKSDAPPAAETVLDANTPPAYNWSESGPGSGGRFAGNHGFDNFIGFLSNPLQNIDPRAMTALWPMFGSTWFTTREALPDGNLQLYGAGLYVALSERLSFGMNQGGYATADFSRNTSGTLRDRFGILHDRREFSGDREGWLNLGGFVQYTVIENVPDQFLLTAGIRWEAPSGTHEIFQGNPPAQLAPYLTAGKALGCFHVLATVGYEFPVGSGDVNLNFFYANLHVDRQFGRLYPLVEINWTYHTSNVGIDLETRHGFVDLGTFSNSGNVVALAVGANAVLVPGRLEFGAVYTTSLATQRNLDFNGVLVKMLLRF